MTLRMDSEKRFKYFFGCSSEGFPKTVIISPFIPASRFKEHCDSSEPFKGMLYSGIKAVKNGKELAVVRCGVGERLMGDAVMLLELARAGKLIFAGSCGGLKGCEIGDIIVCRNAFNGEGFTRYHKKAFDMKSLWGEEETIPADPVYTGHLQDFLTSRIENGGTVKAGDVFTIGSLTGENRDTLSDIEANGYLGVELELSAVFQAAKATGCDAAGMVFVSDLPLKKPAWEGLTTQDKENYNIGVREMIRLSVEFAAQ